MRSEELKHAAKPAAKFDRVSREKRLKRAAAKSTSHTVNSYFLTPT